MTLRIVAIGPSPSATVKLDGRLTGDEVPELRRVCEGVRRRLILPVMNAAESGAAEPVRCTSGVSDSLELARQTQSPAIMRLLWFYGV